MDARADLESSFGKTNSYRIMKVNKTGEGKYKSVLDTIND
jgi:hypothetical protein